jgi:hypothetical protein
MPPQYFVKCKIWWDPEVQSYHVSTPYNQNFVAAIKQLIPATFRHFDDQAKIWVFAEQYYKPVKHLAEKIWAQPGEVNCIDRATVEAAQTPVHVEKKPIADVCEAFVRVLPFDAALSAYRKAATLLHPDKGGDMEKMAQLNMLWNRLQKEVYKQ